MKLIKLALSLFLVGMMVLSLGSSIQTIDTVEEDTYNSVSAPTVDFFDEIPDVCRCEGYTRQYDQGDILNSWTTSGMQNVYYRTAQSFIPRKSVMSHIELYMELQSSSIESTNLTVWLVDDSYNIAATTAAGAPLPTTGIVSTTTFRVASLDLDLTTRQWVQIQLSPPWAYTVGMQYYIVVKTDANIDLFWVSAPNDQYTDGARSWTGGVDNGEDLRFRTFDYDRFDRIDGTGDLNQDWSTQFSQNIWYRAAQSFVAPSHSAAYVYLKMFAASRILNASVTITLADAGYPVVQTQASGAPAVPAANELLNKEILGGAIPVGIENAAWIEFYLPIALTPGATYYLVAKSNSSSVAISWTGSSGDPYAQGQRSTTGGVSSTNDLHFYTQYSRTKGYEMDQGDDGSWGIDYSQNVWYTAAQSFVAHAYFLQALELWMFRGAGDSSATMIDVWIVDSRYDISLTTASGAPLPSVGIKDHQQFMAPVLPEGSADWFYLDLLNINLEPGALYWIVMKSNSSTVPIYWQGSQDNDYPDGQRSWTGGVDTGSDNKFRTIVSGMRYKVDQGDIEDNWPLSSSQNIWYRHAQSFVAQSSKLKRVALEMHRASGDIANGNITVSLVNDNYAYQTTNAAGAPAPLAGDIIVEETIKARILEPGIGNATWIQFDFHPNAFSLVQGATYWIVVKSDQSTIPVYWNVASGNPYAPGQRTWTDGADPGTDFMFRTLTYSKSNVALDQGDLYNNWGSNSYQAVYYTTAQSIVPKGDSLQSFKLKMYRNVGVSNNVNITLWLVDSSYDVTATTASGAPIPTTSVSSFTLKSSLLPEGVENSDYVMFEPPYPSSVEAGDLYWIVVKADALGVYWSANGVDAYPEGQRSFTGGVDNGDDMIFYTTYIDLDGLPSVFTEPVDITYDETTTGHTISMIAVDDNPFFLTVEIDNTLVSTAEWYSGQLITVNVDGLSPGIHDVDVELYDRHGQIAKLSAMVEVIAVTTSTTTTVDTSTSSSTNTSSTVSNTTATTSSSTSSTTSSNTTQSNSTSDTTDPTDTTDTSDSETTSSDTSDTSDTSDSSETTDDGTESSSEDPTGTETPSVDLNSPLYLSLVMLSMIGIIQLRRRSN
ncbi:MAG: hypothetical protein ACXAE3_07345 [Candidatus Kariarchaeaceae archaeon]|jgi:hypothetical protein